ncbi:MAG: hypothetical protein R3215_07695 [Halomonas sp.]|nr:hypothetical protein [Halomonas sp.]
MSDAKIIDWRERALAAEAREQALEQQVLAGLRALGIGCSSIDQCAPFAREAASVVNLLAEQRDRMAAQVRAAQCITAKWTGNDSSIGAVIDALEHWANRADCDPDGDLARLIAEKQAEELEVFASGMREVNDEGATADLYGMARLINTRAEQLRRQAGEA